MHFPDLTTYQYMLRNESEPLPLNVGWLDAAHTFPTGNVPGGFLDRLRPLLEQRHQQTRGFQACQFCPQIGLSWKRGSAEEAFHYACLKNGRLSDSEIRVSGKNGVRYASPRMIVHYVEVHRYLPPQEFIDAVMQLPLPNQLPDPTSPSVTPRADARGAPSVAADH